MENRVIKFRSWSGKSMINNVGIHPFIATRHEKDESAKTFDERFYGNEEEGCMTIFATDNSLMQFTGSLDKNDKEIYEGDIISNGSVKWTVEFFLGAFWLSCDDDNMDIPFNEVEKWSLLEIIGNIFENPELVKA